MTGHLVIADAEVDGAIVDVTIAAGRIVSVGPPRAAADEVVDAGGGSLLPGLHDHHIHLLALAAARHSVACGPPLVASAAALTAALRDAPGTGWIRGVGYHESVAGDLDRWALDAIVARRPCRVQHRSGHAWILNSAALEAASIDGGSTPAGVERDGSGVPTGRLYGADDWLRSRLPATAPDLCAVGRLLAGFGVTAVTDATPTESAEGLVPLAAAIGAGVLPQEVLVTGSPRLPARASPGLRRGPAKIIVADFDLPPLDRLAGEFDAARAQRRPVAVHAVTREALVLALAAWDVVGVQPGDRIEHGAVVPVELLSDLAARGLTFVTQPGFVATRGDEYLSEVDPDDIPGLWRCGSLLAAGVPVGFGTDAPFGDPDPWRSIAAAVERRTPRGAVLGGDERIAPAAALERFLSPLDDPGGPPRRVRPGEPADLCLLDAPLAVALDQPSCHHVRQVWRAGSALID